MRSAWYALMYPYPVMGMTVYGMCPYPVMGMPLYGMSIGGRNGGAGSEPYG